MTTVPAMATESEPFCVCRWRPHAKGLAHVLKIEHKDSAAVLNEVRAALQNLTL